MASTVLLVVASADEFVDGAGDACGAGEERPAGGPSTCRSRGMCGVVQHVTVTMVHLLDRICWQVLAELAVLGRSANSVGLTLCIANMPHRWEVRRTKSAAHLLRPGDPVRHTSCSWLPPLRPCPGWSVSRQGGVALDMAIAADVEALAILDRFMQLADGCESSEVCQKE